MNRKITSYALASALLLPATIVGSLTASAAPVSSVASDEANACTGLVVDETGEPLIGASVMAEGTKKGTMTDLDGKFSLANVKVGTILKISYVGYQTQKVKWEGRPLNIKLQSAAESLGEVVVTAMGIQRKESSLTYATQELKSEDIMKVQDANFVNSLNGKVSGISITQSAGGAGGTSKILLRGNKSVMGNNSPLVVVDGVPMTNQVGKSGGSWDSGAGLGYASDTEGGDALSLINPDDIASINVLKGANAAALYGSAAANGVLMITTKKGKEGKISVAVNSNVNWEKPLCTPELQNVYGAPVDAEAGTLKLGAWGKKLSALTATDLGYAGAKLTNVSRDNVSDFFRTGTTFNNSVAISGGTEKIRSYVSLANSKSDGIMPNNSYLRNTISMRQNYNLFNGKLKLDAALNYVYTKTSNRPGGGTVMNPLWDLYRLPANIDLSYYRDNYVNPEGQWVSNPHSILTNSGKPQNTTTTLKGLQQVWAYNVASNNNPYWLTNMNTSTQEEERVYGSGSATYEIIPGLMVQGRVNFDRSRFTGSGKRYATTQNVAQMEDYGIFSQDIFTSNDWYVDVMTSYNKTFAEDYSVSASAGWVGHTVKGTSQTLYTQATYFDGLSMRQLPTMVNLFEPVARWNSSGLNFGRSSNWDKGVFTTAQFGWKDMVYVEGSYREDWYRAFRQFVNRGTPDHYGYWSMGANTLVHRWAPLPSFVNHLKVRTSYSEVGNSIPNIVYNAGSINFVTGAATGSGYAYFENPLPEKSKSFEAGFDVAFLNSAITWDLTYYNTALTNSYFLAASTGGKSKPVNTGLIANQGVESTLAYNLFIGNDFSWKTGVNVAYNDNKIKQTFLDDQGLPAKMEQTIAGGSIVVRYAQGGQYGDIYTRDFKRNEDGSMWINPNTGTPMLSSDKYIYLGNMNSKWNLGWSNTFRYKDLSLYMLVNGRLGGKFISLTESYLDFYGVSKRTGDARAAAEASNLVWTSADGKTTAPGMYAQGTIVPIEDYYKTVGGQKFASEYVYDATNFRLGEVSVSYSLNNLWNGAFKNVTVSAVGRNLLFLYKKAPSDPDIALSTKNGLGAFDIFNMPSLRSYGVNIKFEF